MPYHLVTVDHVHKTGSSLGLQIAPTVPLARLGADYRSGSLPNTGDDLELRLPDGRVRYEKIGGFGIDGTKRGRYIHVAGDPQKPEMTLYIAGDLEPGDVPSGTEIWLPGTQPGQGTPPTGPCSYCQMKELRAQGIVPPPLSACLTYEPGQRRARCPIGQSSGVTAPAPATTSSEQPKTRKHNDLGGSGTGAVPRWRPVSSPRPSNRACGSPAHGLPMFFTGGIRPSRASPGRAWAG